ncbi:formylglycine-generating enzyme family protein [bacterium]|nr:formylglycine-generating enzyme family protein [bacterium]MBU1071720.1 formylglycine-generating enzyme family protein [bacterium]MBU1674845.1 formylglycine-generating enzyme family protein [bacterium]
MKRVLTLALIATVLVTGCSGDDPANPDPPAPGDVIVEIVPAGLGAGWTLTGPEGYTRDGTGDEQLTGLAPGDYQITWLPVLNWDAPLPQSLTLDAGGAITFTGTYVSDPPPENIVTIDIEPDDLYAAWVLKVETGDGENDRSGHGDAVLHDVPAGQVTADWEEIPGWSVPPPGYVTAELLEGQTLALSVTYTLLPPWPLEFVQVPAGTFAMGSPAAEPGASSDEWPRHDVTLSRDLWVSVAEVTNVQWDDVMGGNREGDPTVANLPVVLVSWEQAVDFCNALSANEGLAPAYTVNGGVTWDPDAPGYRLPTEAEWEHFCRAGTITAISAGELAELTCEPDPVLTYFAWYCPNAYARQPVRSLYPNDWGLYDAHGNVGEFCWDLYDASYYAASPAVDPAGSDVGTRRVVRGGNYSAWGGICRSAARSSQNPLFGNQAVGFRVVRNDAEDKRGAGG